MTSGVNHGIRKSLPHYLGICIGFPLMVAIVGFGMGAIFTRFSNVFLAIKVAGVTYLIYLAWKIANSGNSNASKHTRAPLSFIEAMAFQWLNPKAWAIAIGAIAAFSSPDNFKQNIVQITAVYFLMGFICMGIWLKAGHILRSFLISGRHINYFNFVMGCLLLLSIIPMVLSEIDNNI